MNSLAPACFYHVTYEMNSRAPACFDCRIFKLLLRHLEPSNHIGKLYEFEHQIA
jgi:hypothetical protein